jgi:hypothetical protein
MPPRISEAERRRRRFDLPLASDAQPSTPSTRRSAIEATEQAWREVTTLPSEQQLADVESRVAQRLSANATAAASRQPFGWSPLNDSSTPPERSDVASWRRRIGNLEHDLVVAEADDDLPRINAINEAIYDLRHRIESIEIQPRAIRQLSAEFVDFHINGLKTQIAVQRINDYGNMFDVALQTNRGSYVRRCIRMFGDSKGIVFQRRPIERRMTNGLRLASRGDGDELVIVERKQPLDAITNDQQLLPF